MTRVAFENRVFWFLRLSSKANEFISDTVVKRGIRKYRESCCDIDAAGVLWVRKFLDIGSSEVLKFVSKVDVLF